MGKYVYRTGTYGNVRYGISWKHVLVLVPVPYRYDIGNRMQLITVCSGGFLDIIAGYVVLLRV